MNRARVLAELPEAMADWMRRHGTDDQFAATGRAVAISLGHALLSADGEGGSVRRVHARLLDSDSPAVRTLTAVLGCGRRRWSKAQVAAALVTYFELWGFSRLERRLSDTDKAAAQRAA